ncbi:uncharacterized protein LOC144023832 [Festucalex cinctus]
MMEMAKYLARRELVSTGLFQYNDQPESYRAWKSSFINTIRDLDLTASEELDLLSKWLGKESSEYVRRIRAVHVGNSDAALQMTWKRLDECYNAPEVIENALFKKLDSFPRISNKDNLKLRELGDLLMELLSAKEDGYFPGLSYLDTARGVSPIVEKLPYNLQEKWMVQGSRYKEDYNVSYPPFSFFTHFICHQAKTRNDPSFLLYGSSSHCNEKATNKHNNFKAPVSVHKTNISDTPLQSEDESKNSPAKLCAIHHKPHPLKKCRGFRLKPIEERKAFLKEQGICFRCCSSSSLIARDCKAVLKCEECNSDQHLSALHPGAPPWKPAPPKPSSEHGGEEKNEDTPELSVNSLCTEVCGDNLTGKSCSKICLVKVYPAKNPESAVTMYAMLDDQSNRSLARSELFDLFNIQGTTSQYSLKTCAGMKESSGRRAYGLQIEASKGGVSIPLPELIECNDIPDNRDEIPTPEVALCHPHLKCLVEEIPPLNQQAQILLLLGRDIIQAHKVRRKINGPENAPENIQTNSLGWVLVGDVCLGNIHKPIVSTFKTHILENGRPSLFTPCTSHIQLKEMVSSNPLLQFDSYKRSYNQKTNHNELGLTVFQRTENDEKLALSIEDELFLQTMDNEVFQDDSNSWVAPLPFRCPRTVLPHNRQQIVNRFTALQRTLDRKPKMKEQFIHFMQNLFERNHAEPAPQLPKGKEHWYLPTFGVYHPRKPDQIRVVFDSSAQQDGVSLNSVLLTGPDLANSLLGVLIWFRKERVAVTADIQHMFHCFVVRGDHRDYLRFLWFRNNDPKKDVVDTG